MENVSKDLLYKRRRQGEKLSRQVRGSKLQILTNIEIQATDCFELSCLNLRIDKISSLLMIHQD